MSKPYWILFEPEARFSEDDPNYGIDYWKNMFQNGSMSSPYMIPGVICPVCDNYYMDDTYPFECPVELKRIPQINKFRSPLQYSEHKTLMEKVSQTFNACGHVFDSELMDERCWLAPGMDFLDRTFSICCHPPFSFHWSRIKDSPAVSKEVKDAFESNNVTGVFFHKIKMAYVGKEIDGDHPFEYYQYIYMPGQWEKDRFFGCNTIHIEPEEKPNDYSLYYMYIKHWGADWRDWKKLPRCKLCGKYNEPTAPKLEDRRFQKRNVLDFDVFRSAIPQGGRIIVSKKVYEIINDYGFTNYSLTKLDIHD